MDRAVSGAVTIERIEDKFIVLIKIDKTHIVATMTALSGISWLTNTPHYIEAEQAYSFGTTTAAGSVVIGDDRYDLNVQSEAEAAAMILDRLVQSAGPDDPA